MITDSEDRSMIAELEQIIQAEEAKPVAERDVDLIDDCIREIAELKGVRADFSNEEVAKITDKLVRKEKCRNWKDSLQSVLNLIPVSRFQGRHIQEKPIISSCQPFRHLRKAHINLRMI